jgi:hypothetical protein
VRLDHVRAMAMRTEVSFYYTSETHRSSDVYLGEWKIRMRGATRCSVRFVQTWSAAARRTLSALGLMSSMLDAMAVS